MKLVLGILCCYFAIPPMGLLATPQLLSPPKKQLDAEAVRSIEETLELYWERSLSNNRKSQSSIKAATQDNPQVLVARLLNRIQHGKIGDALPVATDIRQRFKSNLDGPMLEIWLLALTNKYESALVRLNAFTKQLAEANAKVPIPAQTQQHIYGRLGRLMGYFEGPVADKLNPQLVLQIGDQIQVGLSPESLNTFSMNRTFVKTKFKEMLNDLAEFESSELARVAASNEIEKQRLESNVQLVQQTQERLQPRLDQLNETANSQTSVLEQQIQSAASELEYANQLAYRTEQDLAFMYADLLSINRRYRRGYLSDVYALEDQIFRTENQLNQTRNAAINAASNLAALRNQLSATQIRYGRQIDELQNQMKRADVIQKRNSRELQKIAQGPKIASGKKTSRKQRRTALRTYDDLTLELYRQEILDAIK